MKLNINEHEYEIPIEFQNSTLLSVLRNHLRLTGTKCGCGTNDCGACKVIIDGKAINSCVSLVKNLEGKKIETIEGLEKDGHLHPIQQSFIDAGAVQCGFCTPGMIMCAKALLDQNPNPTEEEIRLALDHNLCRCTGYEKIVAAIRMAANLMQMEGGNICG